MTKVKWIGDSTMTCFECGKPNYLGLCISCHIKLAGSLLLVLLPLFLASCGPERAIIDRVFDHTYTCGLDKEKVLGAAVGMLEGNGLPEQVPGSCVNVDRGDE